MEPAPQLTTAPYVKPFAWSYSALTNFETCAKKFYEYFIAKRVKEPENDDMRWGFQVHEAMAKRLSMGKVLPDTMKNYEAWARFVLTNPSAQTILKCEQKLAITADGKACEYFDKRVDPWFRSVLDVIKIRDDIGRIVDWKTGKIPKYSDKMDDAKVQLSLGAAAAFAHYPNLKAIQCQLIYLQVDSEQDVINRSELVLRSDLPFIWRMATPRVQAMIDAQARQDYPPRPSGLCKKHCGVISCPYHGKGLR